VLAVVARRDQSLGWLLMEALGWLLMEDQSVQAAVLLQE
jgi:hypothetical protein